MNSAFGQDDCYLCYILAIWEGLLCVTAELTEMVQYIRNERCRNNKVKYEEEKRKPHDLLNSFRFE